MIAAVVSQRILGGDHGIALEWGKHVTQVSIDNNVGINPDDFIKSLVDHVHNGQGLYVPPTTIRKMIGLNTYLRTFPDPGEKSLVRGRIEKTNRHFRTVRTQAQEKQLQRRLADFAILREANY